jgi:hypothetical protein
MLAMMFCNADFSTVDSIFCGEQSVSADKGPIEMALL